MKLRILFLTATIFAGIGCGSNYGLLRSAMAKKPKIVLITNPPVSKLWIAGQANMVAGHNAGFKFYDASAKVENPKEFDGISLAAAQELKAQLKDQNVTILDAKKVPMKKTSTLGISHEVPDYDKLGYEIVVNIVTNVQYYQNEKIPEKGPYTYELGGDVDAVFLEKKPDGAMGEMGITAKVGGARIKDSNEYSQEQTIEFMVKKVIPTSIVKPLIDSFKQGAADLRAELDNKEK